MKNRRPTVHPQPLLTRDQLFQIRTAAAFARLRQANSLGQHIDGLIDQAVGLFYAALPSGYQLLPYGGVFANGEAQLYAVDPCGNDVLFPCSRFEGWEACWRHSGLAIPNVIQDPCYAEACRTRKEVTELAADIRAEIDRINAGTPEPQL